MYFIRKADVNSLITRNEKNTFHLVRKRDRTYCKHIFLSQTVSCDMEMRMESSVTERPLKSIYASLFSLKNNSNIRIIKSWSINWQISRWLLKNNPDVFKLLSSKNKRKTKSFAHPTSNCARKNCKVAANSADPSISLIEYKNQTSISGNALHELGRVRF